MLDEFWSDLRYRVRALIRRDAVERELDAELLFHIEREAEKYERMGIEHGEALRRARVAFGGIERTKEESRDARGTMLLESVLLDTRYAVRGLRAKPGFTAGVVLTLALGIGANTVMFNIVDRLLIRPPAYLRDAERVHRVYMAEVANRREEIDRSTSIGRYLDFVRWTHAFSSIAAFGAWRIAVGDGENAQLVPVAGVSARYWDLFDARPALGRLFTTEEDGMPSGSPVVVLGYAYWQAAFGGQPDVLGKTLRIGRMMFTIIGVAPKHFVGMGDDAIPSMYLPFTAFAWNARPEDHTTDYHWQWAELVVKRAPNVSVGAANADLTAAFQRSWNARRAADAVERHFGQSVASARPRAFLGPVHVGRGPEAGQQAKVVVWVSGVAVVVLLIACANVANLLLARAVTRHREIALRLALGVGRGRLVRQLITESLVLSVIGGMVGLAVAQWGGAVVRTLFLPTDVETSIVADGRTLLVTLLATVVVSLATGLAPALQAARYDLARSLNAGGRAASARSSRLRDSLLVFQATLSVVLLVGAGLFVRSLLNVRSMRLGYDVDPVLVVTDNMRGASLTTVERIRLEERLSNAARTVPGVVSATPAPTVPFWAYEGRALFVAGIDSVSLLGDFTMQAGNPDYFRTVGTPIVRGRGFDARDRAEAPRVVVVSRSMATALWPAQEPLGKCLRIGADTAPCTTVIGIAEDMRIRSLSGKREYTYYVPIAQYPSETGMVLVRVAGDAALYTDVIRRRLQREMPGAAYVTVAPFRNMIDPAMESWRFGATMFVAFGTVALVLAGIGLYSMIAYGVAQRRKEIGIRAALGASRSNIVHLVVRGGLRPVIAGLVTGGVASLVGGRWMAGLLFDETPTDPMVYGAVMAVLIVVAIIATSIPALAAARVDANIALRAD